MGDQEDAALVRHEVARGVATVTLDSPQNRNALSRALVGQLREALTAADARADVGAIVLTHTGSTFCAGADLREAVELGMEQGTRDLMGLLRLVATIATPVVAVVRGHTRAGGVGLVGCCDAAIVADDSTFAFSESRLGLAPAIISLTTRSRLRDRDAQRLYLTGAAFDGAEAARVGLVTASVAADALDVAVETLLDELRQASPQGLRETKALLNRDLVAAMDRDGEALAALSARLFGSAEARESMRAFREKRPPAWALARAEAAGQPETRP